MKLLQRDRQSPPLERRRSRGRLRVGENAQDAPARGRFEARSVAPHRRQVSTYFLVIETDHRRGRSPCFRQQVQDDGVGDVGREPSPQHFQQLGRGVRHHARKTLHPLDVVLRDASRIEDARLEAIRGLAVDAGELLRGSRQPSRVIGQTSSGRVSNTSGHSRRSATGVSQLLRVAPFSAASQRVVAGLTRRLDSAAVADDQHRRARPPAGRVEAQRSRDAGFRRRGADRRRSTSARVRCPVEQIAQTR